MAEEKHYMRYWVNNDIPTNMATIHTESCPFLKNGIPSKRPADGGWYGPIPNEQVARGIAQACEVWKRDLIVEAEFVNPKGSDWDYGFIIRNPESSHLDIIGLTDEARWFHDTRVVGDDEYTDVASGYLSDPGIALLSRNHLLIIAIEEAGWFFVNDQMVAKLDLGHNQASGGVSAMGDYYLSHQGSPSFENFNVWAP